MSDDAIEIVKAYVTNNEVPHDKLAELVRQLRAALNGEDVGKSVPPTPAVPVKKSVRDDHLICLECGRKCKMLKGHLTSQHRMSIDDYKSKWDLPENYPVTAKNYSAARRNLAKQTGLGRKRKTT